MTSSRRLVVCLDARLRDGERGGVQQYVMGLAAGFADLERAEEDYRFLTLADGAPWLEPFLDERAAALTSSSPAAVGLTGRLKRAVPGWLKRRFPSTPRKNPPWEVRSDGTIERAGIDVMHFTNQDAFLTEVPSIYQPWDLQHIHLPHMFSARERQTRDHTYATFCRAASAVVVATSWAKRDLIKHLDVPSGKIHVVPPAGALSLYAEPTPDDLDAVRGRYSLPSRFLFYPAHTWAHKNHLVLLDAIARARAEARLSIPVVFTGAQTDRYRRIRAHARRLKIDDLVHFLGFVPAATVSALYRLSRGLIFPSLFEGWGLPICEAWFAGVPVACSNATSLPDLAGDAAIVFDPHDPAAVAGAMIELWTDDAQRTDLIERGQRRIKLLRWEETARSLRAIYRSLGGMALDASDAQRLTREPAF